MMRGQHGEARDLLSRAVLPGAEYEQRDEFLASALAIGLARRSADMVDLAQQWDKARASIVRQPIDLLVLLPLGEFAIAAAALGEAHLVDTHLKQAWYLLGRLDDPGLWSAPLLWAGVQAAIARNAVDDVESLAAALTECGAHNRYAGVLAVAARTWSDVLTAAVDSQAVQSAASGLQSAGLGFEAAQLLGAAATRCADRRSAANLLQAARGWPGGPAIGETPVVPAHPDHRSDRAAPDSAAATAAPSAATPAQQILSSRELQVAKLLLRNQTYREIGERLFISPKTVEHHVARMKQRIGASRRSELFAELRVLTAETG
jgi:DNA-binding CsgD family transcriptional regulator